MSIIERLRERARSGDPEDLTDMADVSEPEVYPPATPEALRAAEERLGFALPSLLREVYAEVGHGGFGPGYGLIGLDGGAPDYDGKSAVEIYEFNRSGDPDDPLWRWPEGLLPICSWGCAIYSCLDCTKPEAPVVVFDPNGHEEGEAWDEAFRTHAPSFESWLAAWLDGVDLWEEMYPPDEEDDFNYDEDDDGEEKGLPLAV